MSRVRALERRVARSIRPPSTAAGLASLAAIGGLWALWGPSGGVAGAVAAGAGLLGGPAAAFVVAHVGLLAVAPAPVGWRVVASEVALGPLLVVAATESGTGQTAAAVGVCVVLLAAEVFVLAEAALDSLARATVVVAAGLAAASYLLHRYELVRLGLVTEGES
ncbi:hypothetical protein Hbl1158_14665 [Halobaculum sp. CBA1158]|uniref:hypothetical protein n=1 Tax=Halobaculum sp. CBA1158 TaxID=2904243 RepID=UPI001F1D5F83|nr:hypothetical protein [Halobaculum sp. CBA1158]UIO99743.1 hypothetical protein Hbl1158_14665 [Halobaculum sp. CBA1158]